MEVCTLDHQQYEGGIFTEDATGGRSSAKISLSPSGFHIFVSKTQTTRLLKWDSVAFSVGGSNGQMIFIRDNNSSDVVFSNDKSFANALFTFPDDRIQRYLTELKSQYAAKQRTKKLGCYSWVFAALILCWGVYLLFAKVPDWVVHKVPPSVDISIGDLAADDLSSFGPELPEPMVNDAVQHIMQRLVSNMPDHLRPDEFAFEMQVLDSSQINAFALPGGRMVVLRGLINILEQPEELAAVMAHELSHVTQRHGLKNVVRQIGVANSMYLLVGGGDLFGMVTQIGGSLALQTYSRDAEREADSVGVEILHAAGIDPLHLESAFSRMQAAQEGDVDLSVLSIFSSHPDLNERMEDVRIKASQLSSIVYTPIDVDWATVKQKVSYSNPADLEDEWK